MGLQNNLPPNSSSRMFDGGSNQTLTGNQIISISGDLILQSNGNTTQSPIFDLDCEKENTDTSRDDKKPSRAVTSLIKSLHALRELDQPRLCSVEADDKRDKSRTMHFEEISLQSSKSNLTDFKLTSEPHNSSSDSKGKARASNFEEMTEIRNPDPRVDLISTEDNAFLNGGKLTRQNAKNYTTHMLSFAEGYPLWFPQPDMLLPVEYRKTGITIGDVGIITPDGGFDFLFNIWLPSNHPVNPSNFLSNFNELTRPEKMTSKRKCFNSLGHMCYGAYSSNVNLSTTLLEFTCHKEEGSVIALPDGALNEDLKNEKSLEEFIKLSAESWYRWVTGPGDRRIERNSLYLVTGCMKTKNWGIATYNTAVPPPYNVIALSKSTSSSSELYVWEKQGGAITRTGPDLDEDLDNAASFQNQCMFIRGYKIALSQAAWDDLKTGISVNVDNISSSSTYRLEQQPSSEGHNSGPSLTFSSSTPQKTDGKTAIRTVNIEAVPPKSEVWHPADMLNEILLKQFPQARVAMTHDQIWCDFIRKYGSAKLDNLPLYVLEFYLPHYSNAGAIFIPQINHEIQPGNSVTTLCSVPPATELALGLSQSLAPEGEILSLQNRVHELAAYVRAQRGGTNPSYSTSFQAAWITRTKARTRKICSLNRAGNALCSWHDMRRERRVFPPRNAPLGNLNCGCTYEEALFEESLARHGVGSSRSGQEALCMDPNLRNPLLKLLIKRYGYKDGDFDHDPWTEEWIEGQSPADWEDDASASGISHNKNVENAQSSGSLPSPLPSPLSVSGPSLPLDREILRLQKKLDKLEEYIVHGIGARRSTSSQALWTARTEARTRKFCSVNRGGNPLCCWHDSVRARRTFPAPNVPLGNLNCGCTYEEALFEETLLRHGVGSCRPGDTFVCMDFSLRNPLLKLLIERYGYQDGDFDYNPSTEEWMEGQNPSDWEHKAGAGRISHKKIRL